MSKLTIAVVANVGESIASMGDSQIKSTGIAAFQLQFRYVTMSYPSPSLSPHDFFH